MSVLVRRMVVCSLVVVCVSRRLICSSIRGIIMMVMWLLYELC